METIFETFLNILITVWENSPKLIQPLLQFISSFSDLFFTQIIEAFSTLLEWLQWFVEIIFNAFAWLEKTLKPFGSIWDSIKDVWNKFTGTVFPGMSGQGGFGGQIGGGHGGGGFGGR